MLSIIKKYLSCLIGPLLLICVSCGVHQQGVLLEAESFQQKGGWVVDPQFVEQMGSTYLLAHGLGIPVENARTRAVLPGFGDYHVWVRTMNWAPGDWEAPGRFHILVNGNSLKYVLGTIDSWHWQYAGRIEVQSDTAEVELQDLTGFEGRCDAIYFSTRDMAPPNNPDKLNSWRKEQFKEFSVPLIQETFDLVIVGGCIAGCAAAIAASEQGMLVALIHDRPILGGNASSEIRVHTEGIPWHSKRILSMINTVHWPNGSPLSVKDDKKRYQNIEMYPNIHLYLQWRAYDVESAKGKIQAVDARHTGTGERIRFIAPLFADCTGDGWIGYWAGAGMMYGREAASRYGESWEKQGEYWSPEEPDNRVMGSSLLWRTTDAGTRTRFPSVPWAMHVAGNHADTQGTWHWEFSRNDLHQIEDAEVIRDHMFKAIYGSFYNAKQKSENRNLKLEWISYLIGKRESRRLVGDYIYTFNDMREMRNFPDAVVMEKRAVDVHYQQNLMDTTKPDFLSEALFYRIDHYYIPYRCLYSKNIENLFMAGRCFSCSHIGLGGPRVMNTTGQMGVAVGYAASLCK